MGLSKTAATVKRQRSTVGVKANMSPLFREFMADFDKFKPGMTDNPDWKAIAAKFQKAGIGKPDGSLVDATYCRQVFWKVTKLKAHLTDKAAKREAANLAKAAARAAAVEAETVRLEAISQNRKAWQAWRAYRFARRHSAYPQKFVPMPERLEPERFRPLDNPLTPEQQALKQAKAERRAERRLELRREYEARQEQIAAERRAQEWAELQAAGPVVAVDPDMASKQGERLRDILDFNEESKRRLEDTRRLFAQLMNRPVQAAALPGPVDPAPEMQAEASTLHADAAAAAQDDEDAECEAIQRESLQAAHAATVAAFEADAAARVEREAAQPVAAEDVWGGVQRVGLLARMLGRR